MTTPLPWTDGHLDLAMLAETGRDMTLRTDALHGPHPAAVTLPSLRAAHVRTVIATLFVQRRIQDQGDKNVDGPWCFSGEDEAFVAAIRQISIYREWQKAGLIRILPAPPTVPPADPAPLNVILLLEGAAPLRSSVDLHTFHMNGVRIISLTWVDGTRYAGGDQSGGDVTPEGRQLLAVIDDLAMIHDVSHLSEAAFWTVMHTARRPKIASHSNARALLPGKQHPERHLSDAQIKAIADGAGPAYRGLIGINLLTNFLTTTGRATIADILHHLQHMENLVGRRDFLALGSDMEGGFSSAKLPSDLDHPRHLHRLAEALAKSGWSDDDIHGFAHENWNRFLARTLGI